MNFIVTAAILCMTHKGCMEFKHASYCCMFCILHCWCGRLFCCWKHLPSAYAILLTFILVINVGIPFQLFKTKMCMCVCLHEFMCATGMPEPCGLELQAVCEPFEMNMENQTLVLLITEQCCQSSFLLFICLVLLLMFLYSLFLTNF